MFVGKITNAMNVASNKNNFFSLQIMKWQVNSNKRIMPWTEEKDTYKIWISEIVLQQTRVEQGIGYYIKIVKRFPTLQVLAEASEESLFKVWEGLGYYSRARNLLKTARHVYFQLQGKFPDSYEGLLLLKGIGPYTAAAISSFAYNLPHAVVDGNVFRVLSRFFGESLPIDSTNGKKYFTVLANQLIDKKNPAVYNQAIMDFGATVCKPKIPCCQECFLQKKCYAFAYGLINKLPVKEKFLIKKKRYFTYFIFSVKQTIMIVKRTNKDIWEGLYEFYLYESAKPQKWKTSELNEWLKQQMGIKNYSLEAISKTYKQELTHQTLEGVFVKISLHELPHSLKRFSAVTPAGLRSIAFPKLINQYLDNEFWLTTE